MEKTESTGVKFLKETFTKQAEKYQQRIDSQIDIVKKNAGFIATIAFATGITFASVYYLVKSFSKKKVPLSSSGMPAIQKKKKEMHPVLRIFRENISVFLLAIAREKLVSYLREKNKEDSVQPQPAED